MLLTLKTWTWHEMALKTHAGEIPADINYKSVLEQLSRALDKFAVSHTPLPHHYSTLHSFPVFLRAFKQLSPNLSPSLPSSLSLLQPSSNLESDLEGKTEALEFRTRKGSRHKVSSSSPVPSSGRERIKMRLSTSGSQVVRCVCYGVVHKDQQRELVPFFYFDTHSRTCTYTHTHTHTHSHDSDEKKRKVSITLSGRTITAIWSQTSKSVHVSSSPSGNRPCQLSWEQERGGGERLGHQCGTL